MFERSLNDVWVPAATVAKTERKKERKKERLQKRSQNDLEKNKSVETN